MARAFRIRSCARGRRRARRTPAVLQISCSHPHSRGAADRQTDPTIPARCADAPASRCDLRALSGDGRRAGDHPGADRISDAREPGEFHQPALRPRREGGQGELALAQPVSNFGDEFVSAPKFARLLYAVERPRLRIIPIEANRRNRNFGDEAEVNRPS